MDFDCEALYEREFKSVEMKNKQRKEKRESRFSPRLIGVTVPGAVRKFLLYCITHLKLPWL